MRKCTLLVSQLQTTGSNTSGGTITHTNLEYEFLKRGMCLIFILWVGSKIISPLMPVVDTSLNSDTVDK